MIRRPSLSVSCLTGDPPGRVAFALGLLRDVADEIVVAVDQRVDPSLLGPLSEVADKLVRFEYAPPPEIHRPWLAARCSKDWMLHIDGDEIASLALIERLPSLLIDPDAIEFRLARRWLFPSIRSYLAELPWWPDFIPRLVRRTSDLLIGPYMHGGFRPREPAKYVLDPLYHLTCSENSVESRLNRSRTYASVDPGTAAPGGGVLNRIQYEPERFASLPLASTPADDVEMLERALASVDLSGSAVETPVVSQEVIRAASLLPDDAYNVEITAIEPDFRFAPGERRLFHVEIQNTGSAVFPWGHRAPEIRLSYHLLDPSTGTQWVEGPRTPLPCDLRPGDRQIAPAFVDAPAAPGRYSIRFDLVHEHVRWFGCTAHTTILVAERWQRYRVD